MKKIILAVSILGLGVLIWFISIYIPWWRVKVVNGINETRLVVSRVKLSYVMSRLGVWSKGIRYSSDRYAVPKQVIIFLNRKKYERDQFVDRESKQILYSVQDNYDEEKQVLTLLIGIGDKKDEGEFKMINMLNSQLLITLMRIIRPPILNMEEFNQKLSQTYNRIKPYWRQFVTNYIVN